MAIAGGLRSGAIRSLRRSTRAACSRHAPSRSRSTPRLRCSLLARRPPQRSRRHEVDGSRRRGEIVSAFGAGEEVEEATDGGPQTVTPVSASAWRGSSIAMSGVASRRARIAWVSRCWRFSRENDDGNHPQRHLRRPSAQPARKSPAGRVRGHRVILGRLWNTQCARQSGDAKTNSAQGQHRAHR
jgi:hypothetical protein